MSVLPLPMLIWLAVALLVRTSRFPPKVALAVDKSRVPTFVLPLAVPKVNPPASV